MRQHNASVKSSGVSFKRLLGSPSVTLLARKSTDVKAHRRGSSIRASEDHDLVRPLGTRSQLLPITTVPWLEAIQPAALGPYPLL